MRLQDDNNDDDGGKGLKKSRRGPFQDILLDRREQ
jgi:hypothetical protein